MAIDAARAKSLFLAASDLADPAERAAYLERECGGHADLRARVESLLRANDAAPLPAAPVATVDSAPGQPETDAYADPTARVGATLASKYKLVEEIGEGGMGSVFMAQQTEPVKRAVAVKVIKAGMDSKAVLARFEAERQALAMMDHPNIAKVLDAGTTDGGRPFFVMELVKGVPVTRYCDEHKLTPRQRLELFVPVCQAIQHAHQKGIIHRDIKPSNVLVALYDDRPVPKVIDFGVAKAAGQTLTDKTLMTGFGAMVGTPEYMSPEQASLNNLDIDTRSDVYSLGVLLYELLTGTTPVDKKSLGQAALLEILRIVREVDAPRPSAKLSTIDMLPSVAANRGTEPAKLSRLMKGELDWLVMKALEKDRTRRYETANSLARDIQRFLADEVVEARPPSVAYRVSKFVRRHKGRVIAASLVLLALVIGIIGTTWGWLDAVQARKDEADALRLAEKRRVDAEIIAESNKLLATKEATARLEADLRREQAESLAVRVEFEHYFSKADGRPDLALVGLANLLPKAAGLKDPTLADRLCLHLAAWRPSATRLSEIWTHGREVRVVALSADGKTALTGSNDRTGRLWDTATGKPIGPPLQHQLEVVAVALSADGKTALTGSDDNTARLWDAATGKPIGPPLQHQDRIRGVALSADGKTALTGSDDRTGRLWDGATGKPIGPPLQHQLEITAVALSADGKTALTGSGDGTARLWEGGTGKPIGPPLQHQKRVWTVALSPDGKTALTGSFDGTSRLWDTATGKPIGEPMQGPGAVAFSADGRTALTVNSWMARLWEPATGKPIGEPMRHQSGLLAVALNADGKIALMACGDKTAQLWDTTAGKPIGPPMQHQAGLSAVALSADGKTALTGSWDGTARLWQTSADKPIGPPLHRQDRIGVMKLSADGKTALIGSADKTVRLWDTATGKPIGPPQPHQYPVYSVALSADGKVALTPCGDNTAQFWETVTGKPIGPPLQHPRHVRAVALSADGKTALTGSEDRKAQLWETATGKPIGLPLQHRFEVVAVALSADGKTALTVSGDNTVRLWDTATGKLIGPPLPHQAGGVVIALSADGKTALTAGYEKTARLRETTTGKPIGPPLEHPRQVIAVALSADGKTALTTTPEGARLWETATGKLLGPPLQPRGAFTAAALSADGKTVLTGSSDGTAQLWQVPQPIRGDPERIMLWTQVITGFEVDELTAVRVLDAASWQQRRQRLAELGGPPTP